MTIIATLQSYAAEWRTARQHALTRRAIAGLPQEIRKDIGWPEPETRARSRKPESTALSLGIR